MRHTAISLVLLSLWACSNPEKEAFHKAEARKTISALDSFLHSYPKGDYYKSAIDAKDEMVWSDADSKNTVWFFVHYANEFPEGKHIQEAFERVTTIPVDNVLEAELYTAPFIGQIKVGVNDNQLVSLSFQKFITTHQDSLAFKANLNTGANKYEMGVMLVKSDNSIHFADLDPSFGGSVLQSSGRLYRRNGALFMESTDAKQYWKFSNQ